MSTVVSHAQQNYKLVHKDAFEEATSYMYEEDYPTALSIYKVLYPLDSSYAEINYTIGVCLMNIRGEEDLAFPYLKKAVNGNVREAYFWLGRSYHIQSNFNEAIKYYKLYNNFENKQIPTAEVERYIQMSNTAKEMINNPVQVEIINLGDKINSPYSEYVPVVSSDQKEIYFTSRRPESTGGKLDDYGKYFEDIYYSKNVGGKWERARNIGPPLNTATHDAVVSLTADGSEMVVYRTNVNLYGGDLYLSSSLAGSWSEPVKLTQNINSSYQEASASISPDGTLMYISSNRPGGLGGKDIYRARRLPDGNWSLPQNLGPTINTPYDEDSPFIQADGTTLYFSSNGHNTMGGYDIFKSKLENDEIWSDPKNVGYPINTVKDDIYYVVSPDGKTAYYSSDMEGGYGLQDIYKINILYDDERKAIFKGVTLNIDTQEPIKAKITIIDLYTRKIQGIYNSNSKTGKFLLILQPGRNYKLLAEAKGFEEQSQMIEVKENLNSKIFELDIDIALKPNK
jgi:tetratricopeptide (TPR) repeat protein